MHIDKENCVLYVPKDCIEKYRAAEGWNEFVNIVEIDDTGIKSFRADSQYSTVYDLHGRKFSAEGLSKGVYIINGKKVVVK
jgi:hypothetical protein